MYTYIKQPDERIAEQRRYTHRYLETGSVPFFEPARKLYAKFGFLLCPPFGNYQLDPNSVFMVKKMGRIPEAEREAEPSCHIDGSTAGSQKYGASTPKSGVEKS